MDLALYLALREAATLTDALLLAVDRCTRFRDWLSETYPAPRFYPNTSRSRALTHEGWTALRFATEGKVFARDAMRNVIPGQVVVPPEGP